MAPRRRTELAKLREAAGLSQAKLASMLGVHLDTVRAWEAGRKEPYPRHRGPLADALDVELAELDRLLSGDDLAYTGPLTATLDMIGELATMMERRTLIRAALVSVAAVAGPSRDWLLATLDHAAAEDRRPTSEQVAAMRATFAHFQTVDVTRGGGHARHQLAAWVRADLLPALHTADPSTDMGRDLYGAGAEHLYLLGWMTFDAGDQAGAQRCLVHALRLTQESRNPELGAHVLAGLAEQANVLGQPGEAVQLARTGRAGLSRGDSPACLADLWAIEARAEATRGERSAVVNAIGRSEHAAERVRPESEPEWAKFIPGAYLHGEHATALVDIGAYSEAGDLAAVASVEAATQRRDRRGALAHAVAARAALGVHDLESAAAGATTALELAGRVSSVRTDAAVTDLRARLAEHRDSPSVADFLDLAAA